MKDEATPRTAYHVLPGEFERLTMSKPESDYGKQANEFLQRNGITLRADWHSTECPTWEEGQGHIHGDAYIVTLRGKNEDGKTRRLSFPFWNSANDRAQGKQPTAYDILACLSSDIYTPETFEDFCAEYGYDLDSRRAEKIFRRADRLASRLRAFFTEDEQRELPEIL